jgi:hypothetical protein
LADRLRRDYRYAGCNIRRRRAPNLRFFRRVFVRLSWSRKRPLSSSAVSRRAIRPSTLGRKTYPFAGVDWTAKTNGLHQTHGLAPESLSARRARPHRRPPINHTGQLPRRWEKLKTFGDALLRRPEADRQSRSLPQICDSVCAPQRICPAGNSFIFSRPSDAIRTTRACTRAYLSTRSRQHADPSFDPRI